MAVIPDWIRDPCWISRAVGVCLLAGSRPGGRGTFLCVAKEKYPEERRPDCPGPCASLRATCAARFRRGASELASLKQLPPLTPPPSALLGPAKRDWGTKTDTDSDSGRRGRAKRDPAGARFSSCSRFRLHHPSGWAEERSRKRIRASDCLSAASSSSTPFSASTAGCP